MWPLGDVGNHLGDEEGVVFGAVGGIDGIIAGLFLESVEAADACGNDDADAVFVDCSFGCFVKTGILYGLTGSHKGILSVQVELAHFLAVEMLFGVEVLYLAGKLRLEKTCVEVG